MRKCWQNVLMTGVIILSHISGAMAQQSGEDTILSLIPYPASLIHNKGHFSITRFTRLVKQGGNAGLFSNEQQFLQNMIYNCLGDSLSTAQVAPARDYIMLKYDAAAALPESYRLDVTENAIILTAKDGAGMFYALETLRQLMPAAMENSRLHQLQIPSVTIADRPAFFWRGMHLDVSRHFFSLAYLRKYADMMALYKLNKLHLHLTDDQGWRIEIKKYPLLTEKGAWRHFERHDSICMKVFETTGNTDFEIDKRYLKQQNGQPVYGGYYTQDEMKEFIAYAASRHIEVIPEVDMPGHMAAAASAYPWLTCDSTRNTGPGFSTPICPCNEDVIEFSKNILTEIAALFPSRYIHIGGDEVDTRNWEKAPVSRAFMQARGMSRPSELQGYFNKRIQQFLTGMGKTMIGWDEIVESGTDSNATVMFWRTWAGKLPALAAANGNKVVMTPDGPYYFDGTPDINSVYEVYHYNPLDTGYHIKSEDAHRIIGVQANLWSETIPTEARADYMILPRMTALSEVGWTYRNLYNSYTNRLRQHYPRLDNLGILYRLPDLEGLFESNVFVTPRRFFVSSPLPYFKVRYSTDGTLPESSSPVLSDSIDISGPMQLKLALFAPNGHRGDIYTLNFSKTAYQKALSPAARTLPGLHCAIYNGNYSNTGQIQGPPSKTLTVKGISVPQPAPGKTFGLKFNGYIAVPATGIYSFYLNCNDGGALWIGDEKIIDNDGLHQDRERGGQIALEKGMHPIRLEFFDAGGGYRLQLRYSAGKGAPQPVPPSWFLQGQ
jgi:hexosaminidase